MLGSGIAISCTLDGVVDVPLLGAGCRIHFSAVKLLSLLVHDGTNGVREWNYEGSLSYCRLVDEIVWVKLTVNRRLFKSHGYYLQHAKEVCMIAVKDAHPAALGPGSSSSLSAGLAALNLQQGGVGSDVILSERRGQSQKPEEIYDLIEALVPNGRLTCRCSTAPVG